MRLLEAMVPSCVRLEYAALCLAACPVIPKRLERNTTGMLARAAARGTAMFCSEAAIATNAAFKTRIASAVFARGFNTASLLQRVLVMRERFSGLGAVGVRSFHEDKLPPAPKQKKKEWTPQTFHAGISDAERKSIMAAFDLIDGDENGVIDKAEQEALKFMLVDAGFSHSDVSKALVEMDLDKNGEISREEFIQWWTSEGLNPRSKKIRDATKVFYSGDGQGDDKLD